MIKLFIIFCIALVSCSNVEKGVLLTSASNEANLSEIGKPNYDLTLVSAYMVPKRIENDKNTPWVNVYLLQTQQKDTVAILDTNIGEVGFDINAINPWIQLSEANSYDECFINASKSDLERIKRYKHRYCTVHFVIDD